MTEPLTAQRLAEIKARRALVPHAPWHKRPALTELGYSTHVVCLDASGEGGPENEADVWLHGRNVASGLTGNHAEFVAHAPGDIDALLAEVERLTGVKPANVARWGRVSLSGLHRLRDTNGGIIVASYKPWPGAGDSPWWIFEGDLYESAAMARDAAEAEAARRGWTVA